MNDTKIIIQALNYDANKNQLSKKQQLEIYKKIINKINEDRKGKLI